MYLTVEWPDTLLGNMLYTAELEITYNQSMGGQFV